MQQLWMRYIAPKQVGQVTGRQTRWVSGLPQCQKTQKKTAYYFVSERSGVLVDIASSTSYRLL